MPTEISVGGFLRARRQAMQPEEVGLTRGPHRRVHGLRREEVAQLAGISPEYYLRLEQGRDHQPSAQVLAAIARALRLDDDGLRYLHRLAHPPLRPGSAEAAPVTVPDEMRQLLARWAETPAYLADRNHDILAANDLAMAMSPGHIAPGKNLLAQVFTEVPREPYVDGWERTARTLVAALRFHGDPHDPRLQDLVGTLAIGSEEFRRIWAEHDARPLTCGSAPTHVDPLGWVEFRWQSLDVPGTSGLHLTSFFGEAGSPEVSAIAYLGARIRETRLSSLAPLPAVSSRSGSGVAAG